MYDPAQIRALLDSRKPGHSLPQELYVSEQAFAFDRKEIFTRSWLFVAVEAELPEPGSYLSTRAGGEPILVVRDRQGDIRAFFNACRHRGAQICQEGAGKANRLVCPYHRWTYDLSGALLPPPRMGKDFDTTELGLIPLACETVEGLVHVCLSDDAPDFAPFRAALTPLLAPHRLASARLAHKNTLVERGNWKLVMENARECYHCHGSHPELSQSFPVLSRSYVGGEKEQEEARFEADMAARGLGCGPSDGAWWQAARFALNPGFASMTRTGAPAVSKPMTTAGDDIGSLRWALEPNVFCHAVGDHVFLFSAEPVSPTTTIATGRWLVHPDAMEGADYDLDELTYIWNATNRQDRDLVENNQRGVESAGYRPGPYSPEAEPLVARFVDWYCEVAGRALDRSA